MRNGREPVQNVEQDMRITKDHTNEGNDEDNIYANRKWKKGNLVKNNEKKNLFEL